MINIVWLILMGLGTLVAMGTGKLSLVGNVIFESAGQAVSFTIGLAGIIAFWSGILKVAEASGITADVARWFQPVLSRLFPTVPPGHKALGLISMTIAANFLGLGNIATPLGLKTMAELQLLNPDRDSASDAICTFMALVFGGFCLIPTTLMAIRSRTGSANPAVVIGPIFLVTLLGTCLELIFNRMAIRFQNRNTHRMMNRSKNQIIGDRSKKGWISLVLLATISQWAIPLILLLILGFAAKKRVRIYEVFVQGAMEGLRTTLQLTPYILAIFVAIGLFRTSGAMDFLLYLFRPVLVLLGIPADLLTLGMLKPLSGSAALGVTAELLRKYHPDSRTGLIASIIQGGSETTFYVFSLYLGAVHIKNSRHILPMGLAGDLAAFLLAILVGTLINP